MSLTIKGNDMGEDQMFGPKPPTHDGPIDESDGSESNDDKDTKEAPLGIDAFEDDAVPYRSVHSIVSPKKIARYTDKNGSPAIEIPSIEKGSLGGEELNDDGVPIKRVFGTISPEKMERYADKQGRLGIEPEISAEKKERYADKHQLPRAEVSGISHATITDNDGESTQTVLSDTSSEKRKRYKNTEERAARMPESDAGSTMAGGRPEITNIVELSLKSPDDAQKKMFVEIYRSFIAEHISVENEIPLEEWQRELDKAVRIGKIHAYKPELLQQLVHLHDGWTPKQRTDAARSENEDMWVLGETDADDLETVDNGIGAEAPEAIAILKKMNKKYGTSITYDDVQQWYATWIARRRAHKKDPEGEIMSLTKIFDDYSPLDEHTLVYTLFPREW